MRDTHNNIAIANALNGATIATNTTTDGAAVDTQGFGAAEIIARSSAWTDGAYALSLVECDTSGGAYTAVAAAQVLGAGPSIGAANTLKKIGYLGSKRFIKLRVTSTGTTSGAHLSAVAVLARERHTGGQPV